MLRRRWDVMDALQQDQSIIRETHQATSEEVGRQILGTYDPTLDTTSRIAATAAASILLDMAEYDKIVVTPEDINSAAGRAEMDYQNTTVPELAQEIESWLAFLGLEEVDAEYSEDWTEWGRIWVAPIFPTLGDILNSIENPTVISRVTIQQVVNDTLTSPMRLDEDEESGFGSRSLSEKEIDAALSQYREELDGGWVPIDGTDEIIWINPSQIDKKFESEGDKVTLLEVVDIVSNAVEQSSIDFEYLPDELGAGNISSLMDELENSFGWNRLGTATGVTWYLSEEAFESAYREYAEEAQNIVDNRNDADIEDLQRARTFFEFNKDAILNFEDTSRPQLNAVVRHLESRIDLEQQEDILESAVPGDNLKSQLVTKDVSEIYAAKEFDKKLERLRDEDDEEEEGDKGISSYRF
jgi:hypothetical protein